MEEDLPTDMEENLSKLGGEQPAIRKKRVKQETSSYKAFPDAKIPIPASLGKIWQARRNQAKRRRRNLGVDRAWEEAAKYFFNDQLGHRIETSPDEIGNEANRETLDGGFSETENIVWANTLSQLPVLYAKNPNVEITSTKNDESSELAARQIEMVVNAVIKKKTMPGVNLKPKARRGVLQALLFNRAVMVLDYVLKAESNDFVLEELSGLFKKLSTEKNAEKAKEIEAAIQALTDRADVLLPSGPSLKLINCDELLVDPDATESDGSDANWMMYSVMMSTKYIQAVYGEKDENNQWKSIYKPTHVLMASNDSGREEERDIDMYTALDSNSHGDYGYDNEEGFYDGCRTRVWWVWDKTTRRVMLYHDKDWTYPIWVWDDPLKLDRFFPIYILEFYTNPIGGEAKGEVTYYLDQQDAINEINSDEARARTWARKLIVYNADKITADTVAEILTGKKDVAIPAANITEGDKLEDLIRTLVPPNINFPQLFNKEAKYQAIDRISSTSDVMRGAQFKTNTTNTAIEKYESVYATRQDEKIDAIEDWVGDICWGIAQLCLQHMTAEQVVKLIGQERATGWRNYSNIEIEEAFNVVVVGGSTAKPTSKAKKAEAIEVGQVLGQFTNVSPMAFIILLKVFERAFDEVVITKEDWQMISQSLNSPQGPPGASPEQQQIPPEAQRAIQIAVERGVPEEQATQMVLQKLQGQGA